MNDNRSALTNTLTRIKDGVRTDIKVQLAITFLVVAGALIVTAMMQVMTSSHASNIGILTSTSPAVVAH